MESWQTIQEIRGLTTAASIRLPAAIGIATGMGREATAVVITLFAFLILVALRISPIGSAFNEQKTTVYVLSVEKESHKNKHGNQ